MASLKIPFVRPDYGYPTADGKPMAETDWHRILMVDLIDTLDTFFRDDPDVYVSGNLILCYVPGNRRRHVSPDVFFVRGVPKGIRPNYLTWIEGKGPDVVIELTSSSTRHADTNRKFALYRDVLRVPEYFLFDPRGDYLEPRFQGYRLQGGQYVAIEAVAGRLPSEQLGLHLEEVRDDLRLWDPATQTRLPTAAERSDAERLQRERAEDQARQADRQRERAEDQARQADRQREWAEDQARQADRQRERAEDQARQADRQRQLAEDQARQERLQRERAEDELNRLRQELEDLRRPDHP